METPRRRRRTQAADPSHAVAYLRVSTEDQAESGLGLEAQRAAIEAECERRGWTLLAVHVDAGLSGKNMSRPGLEAAIADVEEARAATLIAAKVDRLSRSLVDFASLMDRSRAQGWALVALDLGVDTTTAQGELLANVMATFAQFERRLIGQRTKAALAAKKARGERLGRPVQCSAEARRRIVAMRGEGAPYETIARALDAAGLATPYGAPAWQRMSVRRIYLASVEDTAA